ncbi:MAG: hypothetical protein OHK0052_11280 [Anaerolineales bacterium]
MPTPYRDLQDEHQRLLEWRESVPDSQEFLNAVRAYIERTRQDSQWITASRSRNQLRANLRFWASYLYDHTGAYPDTSLLPPLDVETGGAYTGGSYSPQAEMESANLEDAAGPEIKPPAPQDSPARGGLNSPARRMSPQSMMANLQPLMQANPIAEAQPQTRARLPVLLGGGALLVILLLAVIWAISNLPNGGSTQRFPEEDTPIAFLPTAVDSPVIEATPTQVEIATLEAMPTDEPLPTMAPLATGTPLVEATLSESPIPTMLPFPTSTGVVVAPEGGAAEQGLEPDDMAANTFLGRTENGGVSSCRSRSVTLRFARPAIFDGIALEPALVQMTEASTGNVAAEARWVMGKPLTINLPVASAETTMLLQITHSQLMFSTHILFFGADCAQNTVQLAFDTLNWQPQTLKSGANSEVQAPPPLKWTLLNWGPAPDGTKWVALLQMYAGENAFYWMSGDTLTVQGEPLMEGRLMVGAAICVPAQVWVNVTLGGETLRYRLILQAPVCR